MGGEGKTISLIFSAKQFSALHQKNTMPDMETVGEIRAGSLFVQYVVFDVVYSSALKYLALVFEFQMWILIL